MATEIFKTRQEELSKKVIKRFIDKDVSVHDAATATIGLEEFEKKLTEYGMPRAFEIHLNILTDAAIDLVMAVLTRKNPPQK